MSMSTKNNLILSSPYPSSNSLKSLKSPEYLAYPRSFPVPDDWNLTITPEEDRDISDELERLEGSVAKSLSKKVPTSNTERRKSSSVYETLVEQFQSLSEEGYSPTLTPVKVKQSFVDDYFDESMVESMNG